MVVNNELERTWKEVIKAQFKVLSYHCPGGLKKTVKSLSQDSRYSGQDFNQPLQETIRSITA
jgi:hypothetical protein